MNPRLLIIWLGLVVTANAGATEVFDLPLKTIDGEVATLAPFRGKALLIVNTASKCGYTKQFDGLQKLYAKYQDRGLVVLGFPSNDFWRQDPGTDAEIKSFCTTKFGVKFPMYAKGPVKGADKQPLFKYLVEHATPGGEVGWNFEKFVVAPDGRVTARFGSSVAPDDTKLTAAIEKVLPESPKR